MAYLITYVKDMPSSMTCLQHISPILHSHVITYVISHVITYVISHGMTYLNATHPIPHSHAQDRGEIG
jgi:hypothetical protein